MPVRVQKKDCVDADGNEGSFVVVDPDGEQHGCHKTRQSAEAQRDAINASEQSEEMNEKAEQTP